MIPEDILAFIGQNNYMTVACIDEMSRPYCFNAFYSFDHKKEILVFSSSPEGTTHTKLLYENHNVSGSILPNAMPEKIQGLQFTGKVLTPIDVASQTKDIYHQQYPESLGMAHEVWAIKPDYIKLTDNARGFGYKSIWKK